MSRFSEELWPIHHIEPQADSTWTPSESGLLAALYHVVEDGGIVDIIAWDLTGPGWPWWLRVGGVTHLGEPWLEKCRITGKPVRLVPSPKDWLADRGEALCILDWGMSIRHLLVGLREIVPTHPSLRMMLDNRLAEADPDRPPIA